jgi:hypothetical protein
MILDELKEDVYRMNRNEYRTHYVSKDMNVNIGEYAVERLSLSKTQHYDRRRKNGKLVVYKGFADDNVLQSFLDRVNGVDREAEHKKIEKELKWFIARQFNVDESDLQMRFDLKAGCSTCTCSPGWLVELPEQHPINQRENGYDYAYPRQYDMWVTLNKR